jgi:hypothetical protein
MDTIELADTMLEKVYSEDYENISINKINKAVGIILKELNMAHGSVGGFDLYKLLQIYFKDIDKREQINHILGDIPGVITK